MKKLVTLSLSLLFVAAALPALAQPAAREKKYFKILEKTFDEHQAYNTVWFVEQR
jgi:aminopeptidase YwaD